jgi:hypothetical protein
MRDHTTFNRITQAEKFHHQQKEFAPRDNIVRGIMLQLGNANGRPAHLPRRQYTLRDFSPARKKGRQASEVFVCWQMFA